MAACGWRLRGQERQRPAGLALRLATPPVSRQIDRSARVLANERFKTRFAAATLNVERRTGAHGLSRSTGAGRALFFLSAASRTAPAK